MKTFQEVIDLWPSVPVLADEIGENDTTVRQWRSRDRIPARKIRTVVEAASRAGFDEVTYALLSRLLGQRKRDKTPSGSPAALSPAGDRQDAQR